MKNRGKGMGLVVLFVMLMGRVVAPADSGVMPYSIVDTGQDHCYGVYGEIFSPQPGRPFFGQDAQYAGHAPAYRDNGDGTVSDLVTGLMWQKTPDGTRRTQDEAEAYAASLKLAGHDDWRVPSIKELFSIVDFRGDMRARTPYIDTTFFDFKYPESNLDSFGPPGQRNMDAQFCSSNRYLGTTMRGDQSAFGFNFADGRLKSYPLRARRYVRCVRGKAYGRNDFLDNGDGTISDRATGLTWTRASSAQPMNWPDALRYAEALTLAGHDDWRLPNVKELQSIVDYTRAPDARIPEKRGPAIAPCFALASDKAWCWSSTTNCETFFAYYVSFGEALSAWLWNGRPMNAHGAGAVRCEPKNGDPGRWPNGLGPQGDQIRIQNYVLCVRGGGVALKASQGKSRAAN